MTYNKFKLPYRPTPQINQFHLSPQKRRISNKQKNLKFYQNFLFFYPPIKKDCQFIGLCQLGYCHWAMAIGYGNWAMVIGGLWTLDYSYPLDFPQTNPRGMLE